MRFDNPPATGVISPAGSPSAKRSQTNRASGGGAFTWGRSWPATERI
jgi:hypothetical protein